LEDLQSKPITKILISGTFSTGKTTLARAVTRDLREHRAKVSLISETARYCPYPLNKNQTFETSLWLMTEQMRREIEMTIEKPSIIICDRGIPDILSHALTIPIRSEQDFSTLKTMKTIMSSWAPTYDRVYWAKIDHEYNIIRDELRISDDVYQLQLEETIKKVFEELNINPTVLPTIILDRINKIMSETSLVRNQNV
jgi:predicted ATPase